MKYEVWAKSLVAVVAVSVSTAASEHRQWVTRSRPPLQGSQPPGKEKTNTFRKMCPPTLPQKIHQALHTETISGADQPATFTQYEDTLDRFLSIILKYKAYIFTQWESKGRQVKTTLNFYFNKQTFPFDCKVLILQEHLNSCDNIIHLYTRSLY